MQFERGRVISGTLRLVRRLAEGGMGTVWMAEHIVLGTRVAVKFIAPTWAMMPGARSRFLREARLTARAEGTHVVRVLDCRATEADEPYLVLELLDGENLEQRVRRCGPLSLGEVEGLVTQLCEALATTHAAHVIHRDVKPENVFLVAGQSTVKLLDFGIAKSTLPDEAAPSDGLAAGTPQYMSPEHLFDPESTDARSDLFSLASVAYFALTGRAPFCVESLEGLYFAIDAAAFDRPSRLRPELPAGIDRWFERALARLPEHRFTSPEAMACALSMAIRQSHTARSAPELHAAEGTGAERRVTLRRAGLRSSGLGVRGSLLVARGGLAACAVVVAGSILSALRGYGFATSIAAAEAPDASSAVASRTASAALDPDVEPSLARSRSGAPASAAPGRERAGDAWLDRWPLARAFDLTCHGEDGVNVEAAAAATPRRSDP